MSNDKVYFATKEAKDVASVCIDRSGTFFQILRGNNYLDKITKMWRYYHGFFTDVADGHQISFGGEIGELTSLPVNHFRNIAQHIYNMITSNRPIMEARAVNTDYKSLAQTYVANGILDYYMREKRLEDALKKAVEMSIVMGAGFVKLEWNATAGDSYDTDPDTGEFIYEGDIEFSNLSPLDVVVDGTKENWNHDWMIVRNYQNRFNLMAKYPEIADKIRDLPSKNDAALYRMSIWTNDATDDIPVYEFYHKRTDAMPDGRYILFASPECVLLDTKMPYRTIPVYRIAPNDILGTPYGYTPMFDIFPIQEGLNGLYSTIMTNQNAFGVQNLWIPRGADISHSELAGGLNIIESEVKPEALNFTQTPAEVFKFIEMLIQAAETISGVNSVARGNPESSLKSGTALALVQSMALQFMSGLQQSYVKLVEEVGTGVINILKDFSTTPKIIAIVGKNNRTELKEFTGEDISAVSRVIVDVGNPLSRCLAKNTPVLMFDGSIKMVQDVVIGEQIMGPDSYPRTVGNVNSGEEMMYEITSKDKNRNIKYGCNESHILTLRYCSDDFRYDAQQGDIIDITVREYLQLPERHRRLLQGFTTGVEFEQKNLEIPPYILGSWLGDGTSRSPAITTMDQEMVDEWTNYAHLIGMKIRVQENRQPNKSKVYFITSGESHGNSDRNPFMNGLRSMELICNKHIPSIYLKTSRKDRLELLAGLIDTDGHRIDETFIFTQKSERLSMEVVHLAKSLGFRTTYKKVKASSSKLVGEIDSETFKISIGGDTWEIPTRLPRKKCKKKEKVRNPLNYGISVECKGVGTYYGFTLIEEPHFLLGDFTVTHNTIAGRVQMAEQMLQMNLIKSPQQYFQVMNTGRLDSMYDGDMHELLLIKNENEKLMQGEPTMAFALDQHRLHIMEHRTVLADPDLRKNNEIAQNVLQHIQEHIDLLRTTNPDMLQLIGEQPLQPPPQQGGAPEEGLPNQPPMGGNGSNGPVLQNPQGQNSNQLNGPNGQEMIPSPAKPPAPFQNLPTDPKQMG